MRLLLIISILFAGLVHSAHAQHEYASIEEKDIEYKDWTYKNALNDQKINLREFTRGKKLVLVFYFAPWCHSSRYQAPITQAFYKKYKDRGFAVIGISMYDSEAAVRAEVENKKITFPVVVESTRLAARRTSRHYKYRRAAGDHRKWGTPWNLFLIPDTLNGDGKVLTGRTFLVNGELIPDEADAFIRSRLGLPVEKRKQ